MNPNFRSMPMHVSIIPGTFSSVRDSICETISITSRQEGLIRQTRPPIPSQHQAFRPPRRPEDEIRIPITNCITYFPGPDKPRRPPLLLRTEQNRTETPLFPRNWASGGTCPRELTEVAPCTIWPGQRARRNSRPRQERARQSREGLCAGGSWNRRLGRSPFFSFLAVTYAPVI
jgi:hypothetical protein